MHVMPGISLANKCQLLFGAAIVVILTTTLAIPWVRSKTLVRESQLELARQLADAWLAEEGQIGLPAPPQPPAASQPESHQPDFESQIALQPDEPALQMSLVRVNDLAASDDRSFAARAYRHFQRQPEAREYVRTSRIEGVPVHRYARAIRASDMPGLTRPLGDQDQDLASGAAPDAAVAAQDAVRAMLIIDRTSEFAEGQLLTSRVFITIAGIVSAITSALVFHFILTRLILSPVRTLRSTAERVQEGDLHSRALIQTRDEFEQLAHAFNTMLDRLGQGQMQLRSLNETLDLKVGQLAEANVSLFESNRLKSEFLANVSHELRTPLNSIIGFAELLDEIARSEDNADPKRVRYIRNILTSSRSLLEMINDLLNMAKIESGRIEINIEPTNLVDLIDGLAGIMRPQAQAREITVRTMIGEGLPRVETDPGKLQQILYNFLSNAIKFTPVGGSVTLSADRISGMDGAQRADHASNAPANRKDAGRSGVRIAVSDTGPGIPYDMQDVIFEKFRQIDASHTRQHQGTGLGLAICRELAQLLGASVSFVSEPGRGATFFVDLPLTHAPRAPQPLMA